MTRAWELDSDAVEAGQVAWEPWRYVGQYVVAECQVTPDKLEHITSVASPKLRKFVADKLTAVVESTKAINRMVGRAELAGIEVTE